MRGMNKRHRHAGAAKLATWCSLEESLLRTSQGRWPESRATSPVWGLKRMGTFQPDSGNEASAINVAVPNLNLAAYQVPIIVLAGSYPESQLGRLACPEREWLVQLRRAEADELMLYQHISRRSAPDICE